MNDLIPKNLLGNPLVLMLVFAAGGVLKELVVGVLHGLAKKWRADKDPSNDVMADGADAIANAVDKLGPKK